MNSCKSKFIALFAFASTFHVQAQVLDRVSIEGEVSNKRELQLYSLDVVYKPMKTKGAEIRWRQIKSISLILSGKKIEFPKTAFEDLTFAHEPTPLKTDAVTGNRHFEVGGGDGELSYRVVFYVNDEGLVRRELFRHMVKKPEVLRFHTE